MICDSFKLLINSLGVMICGLFCDLKFISKGPEIEDSRTPKK